MRKRLKRISFCKGSATFLEFIMTSVFLTVLLLIIVSAFMKYYTIQDFDLYVSKIARDVVTCSSMEEAEELAWQEANELFQDLSFFDRSSMTVSVMYVPGSGEEWKKGNFINVTVTGYINAMGSLTGSYHESNIMMMIEHNEERE